MQAATVVVGADFSNTGDQAIRAGLKQLAAGVANTVYVVHVVETGAARFPPEERPIDPAPSTPVVLQSLQERTRKLAELDGITYREAQLRVEVRSGGVVAELLAAIHEHGADLAIVGTHGRQGVARWLAGSVAEALVRTAACSVLVTRPARHVEGRHESAPTSVAIGDIAPSSPSTEGDWRPRDRAKNHPIP